MNALLKHASAPPCGLDIKIPTDLTVTEVKFEGIIALRNSAYPNASMAHHADNDKEARHYAIIDLSPVALKQGMICCASFVQKPVGEGRLWQVYGVVTKADLRGRGYRDHLLNEAEKMLFAQSGIGTFRSDVKSTDITSYSRNGWRREADKFNVPLMGQHCTMVKKISV